MKIRKPTCIICEEKPARIGKQDGFPQHVICSQKCATNHFLMNCSDITLCKICGEWTEVCGNCEV